MFRTHVNIKCKLYYIISNQEKYIINSIHMNLVKAIIILTQVMGMVFTNRGHVINNEVHVQCHESLTPMSNVAYK